MDEKELIRRTKNSLKAKKSRAEILNSFQKRGYKLAYAEKIIEKSTRPKKIALIISVALLIIALIALNSYTFFVFSQNTPDEQNIPISGNAVAKTASPPKNQQEGPLEITPEMITELLSLIGANQLHKAAFFGDPVINIKLPSQVFNSKIREGVITTTPGQGNKADIEFVLEESEIEAIFAASDKKSVMEASLASGKTQVNVIAGNAELLAKGYWGLHESLK